MNTVLSGKRKRFVADAAFLNALYDCFVIALRAKSQRIIDVYAQGNLRAVDKP